MTPDATVISLVRVHVSCYLTWLQRPPVHSIEDKLARGDGQCRPKEELM